MRELRPPLYALEGIGAMDSLEKSLEVLLTKQLSKRIDESGLTRTGVLLPEAGPLSGMGELGAWNIGKSFSSLFARITGRQKVKARKAQAELKKVRGDVAKINREAQKGVSPARSGVSWFRRSYAATKGLPAKTRSDVAAKAVQTTVQKLEATAVAPRVTKDEIMDEAKPMIRSTARAIAKGVRAPAKGLVGKAQERELIAIIRQAAGAIEDSPTDRVYALREIARRASDQVARARTARSVTPRRFRSPIRVATPREPMTRAGSNIQGIGQIDVDTGADAFGQVDVDTGADAFGQIDVESGADAFAGLAEFDVNEGADAF